MRYEVRLRDERGEVYTAWKSPATTDAPNVDDFNEATHALKVIASLHIPGRFSIWLSSAPDLDDLSPEDYATA